MHIVLNHVKSDNSKFGHKYILALEKGLRFLLNMKRNQWMESEKGVQVK